MALVLVVDDEKPVRDMIRRMLEKGAHRVVEARDGAEALQSFREHRPDLVITDILMPNQGGLIVIREVRDLAPEAPIIAISGGGRSGRLSFLSTARTFPGVRTLKKPFRQRELTELVARALTAPTDGPGQN